METPMSEESRYARLGAEDKKLVDDYIAAQQARYRGTRVLMWNNPSVIQEVRENWSSAENLAQLRVKNERGQSAVLAAIDAVDTLGTIARKAVLGREDFSREEFDRRVTEARSAVQLLKPKV
jgi:hypothetical protein